MAVEYSNPGLPTHDGFWRQFARHRLALLALALVVLLALLALFAPALEMLLGLDAGAADLFNRLAPPSADHWLGTDEAGRDVFLRLLYGGRVSLMVGIIAALLAALLGTMIGLIAGYFGGWPDGFLMRATDAVIALPLLPLLIVLAAVDPQKLGLPDSIAQSELFSLYRIILIISLVGWTTVARLVRAETLSLRRREFVIAARAQGLGSPAILCRHILPNVASPIVVATTLTIGNVILLESVLSFLALGIQPPTASWGNMLNNVQDYLWDAPMLAVWPGLMIFVTVIAFNFLGDGLQDALDPRARR
ncbi:ABC transporter permease [Aestuariispira insulae]|uniref:Peptide/nickel transport system permease protein n=1 Tax=Aestuariispira insulae TaxID=1461337 RepID=A0A3D9HI90_9PROT|nr:ABC transporter permease [Aestuariispira insulae]RED49200.1 peptide/nickel transport system permease protein [Aestuariispira insulae]